METNGREHTAMEKTAIEDTGVGDAGQMRGGRPVLRCLLFAAGLLVLLCLLSQLVRPKDNREDFGMGEMKANAILTEREGSIDVVAVGDSECALAISPMAIWQAQGIASYNCGTAGQYLYESYNYLCQAFEKQEIRLVLLDTNVIFRECDREDWLFSKLERRLPVFFYHNRWKSMRAEDLGPVAYTWRDEYKGWMFYTESEPYCGGEYMIPTDAVREIPDCNMTCLEEIVRLCSREGAELLFVSTPGPLNWDYESHNAVQALAEQWEIPYLDMNLLADEIGIDWETETKDAGDHLNYLGAEKASFYLGRYLAEHYELTDHRGDAAYADWEEDFKVYQQSMERARAGGEAGLDSR